MATTTVAMLGLRFEAPVGHPTLVSYFSEALQGLVASSENCGVYSTGVR
jgi:hypothetical protein